MASNGCVCLQGETLNFTSSDFSLDLFRVFAQVFFFWRAGLSKKKCHVIYVDKRLSGETPQVKFWLGANALETDLGMIRDMTQWIDWWNCIFVSLSQGKRWYLEGTAKVIDPQEPAKLGVNFLSCRYLLYHLYMYIYCFNCYNTPFNILFLLLIFIPSSSLHPILGSVNRLHQL